MKECKVVQLSGRRPIDWAEDINTMLSAGWKLIGSFGKNNMLMVFTREINVNEEEE